MGINSWWQAKRREEQAVLSAPAPGPGQLPWPEPLEEKEPSLIDKARDQFKCAHYCNEFRTIAFIHPFMPDRQEYLRAICDDDKGASWVLSIVRTEENDAQGPATSLLPPMKTGVNFLEAMEEVAIYEQGEHKRGAVPVQSAEDLGDLHYRRAGKVEGLIFNMQGAPRPTWRGQVVVPDDYPPDVWDHVNVRPDLAALSRDTVASTIRRMTCSMTAQHVAETEKISFSEHYQRLLGDMKVKEQLSEMISLQEHVTSYHSSMIRQLEKLERAYPMTGHAQSEYSKDYIEIVEMGKALEKAATQLVMGDTFKDIRALDDPVISSLQALMQDQMAHSVACNLQILHGGEKDKHLNDETKIELQAELMEKIERIKSEEWYEEERYQPLLLLQFMDAPIPVMAESYKIRDALYELVRQARVSAERHKAQAMTSLTDQFNRVADTASGEKENSHEQEAQAAPEKLKPSRGGGMQTLE